MSAPRIPEDVQRRAEANVCDPHHFVWTWPIEGGRGSVGVCDLCGAVTTGERDAAVLAEAARPARLAQLAPDLWVDAADIDSVRTYTDRVSYARKVVVYLRSGREFTVTVPGSSGGTKPASVGDRLLSEWLAENLGELLSCPGAAK